MVKLTHEKIPYFNAPIYLQNMTQIGKVEEIFGPINESVSSLLLSSSFFFYRFCLRHVLWEMVKLFKVGVFLDGL